MLGDEGIRFFHGLVVALLLVAIAVSLVVLLL